MHNMIHGAATHEEGGNGRRPPVSGTSAELLLQKIATRQARVGVIGLGYVGLPLAVVFAEAGFTVVGIDLDASRVAKLNAGESHIEDVPAERVAALLAGPGDAGLRTVAARTGRRSGSFHASSDYDDLCQMDAVIICVPTPLTPDRGPDVSSIAAATAEIARRLPPGMLVVLESTTYPGTTEELLLPRLSRGPGTDRAEPFPLSAALTLQGEADRTERRVGRDFFLAFSPERIDPGRVDWTVRTTPKVIGGVTPDCLKVASALYRSAMDTVVPVSSPRVAEMVKLLENTFRALNIGLANEMAIICDHLGIDVWEVIDAARTKPFGFMPFYPGPGLGGHCIPIDPLYLSWKLRTLNYHARFIQLAEEVNGAMPDHVVRKVADALNTDGKPIMGARIVLLGMAYKANVADSRESPSLEIAAKLIAKGARLSYNDPHVPQVLAGDSHLKSVPLDEEVLRRADCVLIATAHDCYDWAWVLEHSRLVVDTRNATRGMDGASARVIKL